MVALQNENLNVFLTAWQEINFSIIQNCYFKRNDGCLAHVTYLVILYFSSIFWPPQKSITHAAISWRIALKYLNISFWRPTVSYFNLKTNSFKNEILFLFFSVENRRFENVWKVLIEFTFSFNSPISLENREKRRNHSSRRRCRHRHSTSASWSKHFEIKLEEKEVWTKMYSCWPTLCHWF